MRLIDADELKKIRHEVIQGRIKFDGNECDLIDKCPTVDAVPVVRCEECKYRSKDGCPIIDADIWMDDEDFCSHGERKEGDE